MILFNSKTPEYAWLSNFWQAPVNVLIDDIEYTFASTENLYAALKNETYSPEIFAPFLNCHPAQAKLLGHKCRQRQDWPDVKLEAMRIITNVKFSQHPHLAQKLIATGKEPLLHYAPWGDRFWGVMGNEREGYHGHNWHGRIIMEKRERLQKETP